MNYSKAHQNFSTKLQNPEVLTNPQDFLGPNYETVINFWLYMDNLTKDQWKEVARRWSAAWSAAWYAAGSAAGDAAWSAARYATYELIGMHTLLNDGKDLLFVPLFDFTKEEPKKEPPLSGEIFNMSQMRYMFISTPNTALGGLQSFMRRNDELF